MSMSSWPKLKRCEIKKDLHFLVPLCFSSSFLWTKINICSSTSTIQVKHLNLFLFSYFYYTSVANPMPLTSKSRRAMIILSSDTVSSRPHSQQSSQPNWRCPHGFQGHRGSSSGSLPFLVETVSNLYYLFLLFSQDRNS